MHSYHALKYAGKPWIHQSFKSTISPNFFTAKLFYRQTFLLYGISENFGGFCSLIVEGKSVRGLYLLIKLIMLFP